MSSTVMQCTRGILAKLKQPQGDFSPAEVRRFAGSLIRKGAYEYVIVRTENLVIIYFFDESLIEGVLRELASCKGVACEQIKPYIVWVYEKIGPPSAELRKSLTKKG